MQYFRVVLVSLSLMIFSGCATTGGLYLEPLVPPPELPAEKSTGS